MNLIFYRFKNYTFVPDRRVNRKRMQVLQVLASGTGFLSDSYDIFAINLVVTILSDLHPMSATVKALIIMSCTAGTIVGQIGLGWISDYMGRQKTMLVNAGLLILATIGSASSPNPASLDGQVLLCLFRFLMGVGIGGDYASASSFASETAKQPEGRGRRIASVFSMQGIGAFLATLVSFLLLSTSLSHSIVWRLILIFGILPSLGSIGMRFYHFYHDKSELITKYKPIPLAEIQRPVWRRFAGTSINWFLLDIVFYGNSLLSSSLVSLFVNKGSLSKIAGYTCLLAAIALPGYWFAIWAIDVLRIGRFRLQLFGFIGLVVSYSALAIGFDKLIAEHSVWAIFLYAVTFFISNAGPNTTTFVIPAEVFPSRLRGRFHGMSAAAGKFGALVGTCKSFKILTFKTALPS